MARTVGDTSTSVDSWWFLNPELSQLAKPALVLVTQWTWHEKAAKELLWEGAARGSIRWYAEIEIQEDNPVFKTRAGLLTFNTAVNQGLWHPHYFTMDWEASRGIYLGPAILLIRNPECPEEMHVRYDGRASTHIVARLMRFHRGDMAADARRRGLLSAPVFTSEVPPSEPRTQVPAETRLQKMERAGFFKSTRALQDAADYARESWLDGCVPDDVAPAQFARGLEEWLKVRDKKKAVSDQWHTADRFLREYRRQS